MEPAARAETQTGEPGSWRTWPGWVMAVMIAATLARVLFLEWKSPHFDEGINGHFVNRMWNDGYFTYDPTNFHGPLHFYILQFGELVFGRGVFAFRIMTALLSAAAVFVAASHARFLGRSAYWAAAVVALSPAMVFYGRYGIHESLFILCQLVFSYGFIKWRTEGGERAAVYMVVATAAAIATKETFYIFMGTWLIAWALTLGTEKIPGPWVRAAGTVAALAARPTGGKRVWIGTTVLASLSLYLLFTGFTARPEGFLDMFRGYAVWTQTGTASTGHEKPFFYWISLFSRYEWPALLALIAAPVLGFVRTGWIRFFALLGFGIWLAYSIIPYKTPWCIIGLVWPLAFVFGNLVEEAGTVLNRQGFARGKRPLSQWLQLRMSGRPKLGIVVGSGAALALTASIVTMLRLNFRDFEAAGEPYVYVQTTQDVNQVMALLETRVRAHPEDRNLRIHVMNKDPWPLPWLLSLYTNIQYGGVSSRLEIDSDVVLADGSDREEVELRIKRRYWRRPFRIRDAYDPGFAYFDFDRFNGLMASHAEIVSPPNIENRDPRRKNEPDSIIPISGGPPGSRGLSSEVKR